MISFLCETYIMFPVSGTNFMFLVLLNLQIPKNCGFIKQISVILQNKTKTNPNNNILLQEKFQDNKTRKCTESTLKISFRYVSYQFGNFPTIRCYYLDCFRFILHTIVRFILQKNVEFRVSNLQTHFFKLQHFFCTYGYLLERIFALLKEHSCRF